MGKLSKQQQQMLVLIVMFAVGGGYVYWNYLLKPTLEKEQKYKQEYKELEEKIERAKREARRLPALQNELETLRKELSSLEHQLPTDKDIPNVLRTLTREAQKENMEFTRLGPGKPQPKQYFEALPFDLGLVGDLHSFIRFLSSLGQQDRIFKTGNIKLSPGSSSGQLNAQTILNVEFNLETYAYKG